jgi:hypothetical protein
MAIFCIIDSCDICGCAWASRSAIVPGTVIDIVETPPCVAIWGTPG